MLQALGVLLGISFFCGQGSSETEFLLRKITKKTRKPDYFVQIYFF
jgi:hypothetical protein